LVVGVGVVLEAVLVPLEVVGGAPTLPLVVVVEVVLKAVIVPLEVVGAEATHKLEG
jgi:hypothetical protein